MQESLFFACGGAASMVLHFTECDRKVAAALAMPQIWFVTGWCAGVLFCSAWSVLLGGGTPRSFLCPVCLGVRDAAICWVDASSERGVESRAVGGARRCGTYFVTGLDELAKHVSGVEGVAQF